MDKEGHSFRLSLQITRQPRLTYLGSDSYCARLGKGRRTHLPRHLPSDGQEHSSTDLVGGCTGPSQGPVPTQTQPGRGRLLETERDPGTLDLGCGVRVFAALYLLQSRTQYSPFGVRPTSGLNIPP